MHKHIVYFYNSRDRLSGQVYTKNLSAVENQKNNSKVPPTHTLLRVGGTFLALWITFFVRIVAQDLRLAGGLASF